MTTADAFRSHFEAGLDQLQAEVEAYPDEALLWQPLPGTTNPAGNLCLHLCGNLQHYLGAALGHTGYVREREAEFTRRDVPRTELLQQIAQTRKVVRDVLMHIDDWRAPYPEGWFRESGTIEWIVLRLLRHFWYHLGQINYHRRAVTAA